MASYKVPQNVEADDKLIGPFSFRQFIYLMIVAMAIAIGWGLSQLFIGLAILPLPIIVFFGALALPLRKDQPMEIYMAAIVSYYLKPRFRRWDPEGVETLIEISAPKVIETRRTKDISQNEAEARLSYLANIVDSGGWAIRGVSGQPSTSMNNDVFLEAQNAPDVLDNNTTIAHNFDQMMTQSTARVHEEAKEHMMQAAFEPYPVQQFQPQDPSTLQVPAPTVQFNPYPTFHQSIIQPLNDTAHQAKSDIKPEPIPAPAAPQAVAQAPAPIPAPQPVQQPVAQVATTPVNQAQPEPVQPAYVPAPPPTPADAIALAIAKQKEAAKATSDKQLKADIINLANNPDISIETIAQEAKRIHKKAEEESDEVVISLR